jgi:hypothetical protein
MSKTRRPKYRDGRNEDEDASGPRDAAWAPRPSWADLDWREEERVRDGDRRRNEDRGWFSDRDLGDMDWDASDYVGDAVGDAVEEEEEDEE